MKRYRSSLAILTFGAFCARSTVALAADEIIYATPDKSLVFVGGTGY